MAVLEKIRVKMGAFITILIAVALLSFIIDPDTLQSTVSVFSSKYNVGEIDGTGITYQDYQKKVDYFTNIYQITSGGNSQDERAQEMINNSAWQDEVAENLLIPTAKKAGINVGDEELLDLTQGSGISPVLANEAAFQNEKGEFDKAKLVQFAQAVPQDQSGNLKLYWNYLESNIVKDAYFSKYASLFEKSLILNPLELKRAVAENNTTFDVDFVVKPFGFGADSTIVVSESEIKSFYDKNKNSFKQGKSNDLEYVVFDVVPSGEDINLAEKDMEKVVSEFETTEANNIKAFITRNSDIPYNGFYFKADELASLAPELDEFVKGANVGSFLAPFRKDNSFIAAKVTDIKNMPDSVEVQHILVQAANTNLADSLFAVVSKGGNFAELAKEYSLDKNPNVAEPGDLGWMTQQYTIPGFEDIFKAKAGDVLKLNTNYGVHIVKVKKTTAPVKKFQIPMLVKEAKAGKVTYSDYYAKANELVNASNGDINRFRDSANAKGYAVMSANAVAPGAKQFGGYKNVREITRWATENKVGSVSPIMTVDNQYFFVVAVKNQREEGIAPLKDVASQIKNVLSMQKKGEKLAAETKTSTEGATSIEQVAEKLGTTVSSQSGIAFSSMNMQQLDPKFVGAIAAAPQGKVVGPVVGEIGVYYFIVKDKSVGEFFTEQDAKNKEAQEASYITRVVPAIIAEDGKVVDQRYKFY